MSAIVLYLVIGALAIAAVPYWFNAASCELRNAKKYGPKSWR